MSNNIEPRNEQPTRLEFRPHEYQKTAINYAVAHKSCMLALDMGLGKTAITLYAISWMLKRGTITRVLIIAPLYVAKDTWVREIKKWDFADGLTYAVAVGSPKKRREAVEGDAQIVTINRENTAWIVNEYLRKWNFDMIVIDESSSFKAYDSKRFKSLKTIRALYGPRVVELTGTPRPRSIEDLWSQMYLLDGGMRLGRSITAFRTTFCKPGKSDWQTGTVYEWIPVPGAELDINRRISDICMSMSAADYLSVPEMTVIDHMVELPAACKKKYKELCRDMIAKIGENPVVAKSAGALAGKLCQLANGAVYQTDENGDTLDTYDTFHDEKLNCLQEILESTEEPIIIFYWFKHDRSRLMRFLAPYEPREIKNEQDIADWNNRRIRVLLAHPASMGHGLNLQDGGHIMVWFSMTWSLELYQQANARLHRQGQKNAVQVHRILAADTIDTDIVRSLEDKNAGQSDLLEAVKLSLYKHSK